MKKIKLGILGATRGINFALSIKKRLPEAEVTAVCDHFEPLLNKVGNALRPEGLDPELHYDFDSFLKSGIDAVLLANNANEHAPYAIRALRAGKHVLSEVQPVQTPAEAVALCEAVEQSGLVYRYAENYCYFRNNFEARLCHERGEIGEIVSAEGDFINDCSNRWHLLTRGLRNHWRNLVPSTFYCTHSIGPMLFSAGLRPVSVSAFETPCLSYMSEHGARNGSIALEIITLENGAIVKSLHGNLKRPWISRLRLTGTHGAIETSGSDITLYKENSTNTGFDARSWEPETCPFFPASLENDAEARILFCFFAAIRGNHAVGRYGIDIYQALDMALPGIFGYRSILSGGISQTIPDFRDPAQRKIFRNDNCCTDPKLARGKQLQPSCSKGEVIIPETVYAREAEKLQNALQHSFRLGMN